MRLVVYIKCMRCFGEAKELEGKAELGWTLTLVPPMPERLEYRCAACKWRPITTPYGGAYQYVIRIESDEHENVSTQAE